MKELKKVDGVVMFVDVPEEVIAERRMLMQAVRNLPETTIAEVVTFAGESNGKRNTEKQASLYDIMMAKMIDERNAEKARVRNRRERAKQDKLRSKTYLRIITEIKPDAELVALNEWLKYA